MIKTGGIMPSTNIWIMMMMTWLYIAEKSIFIFEWFSLIAPGNGVFFLACGQSSGWFPTQRPVMHGSDGFLVVSLNSFWAKQSGGRSNGTPWQSYEATFTGRSVEVPCSCTLGLLASSHLCRMPRLSIPHLGWWLCYVCGMPIVCYYLSNCTLAPCMAPHQQPR